LGTAFVLASADIGLVSGSGSAGSAKTGRHRHADDLLRCDHDRIWCHILAADAARDAGGLMTRQDVPPGLASLVLAAGAALLHPAVLADLVNSSWSTPPNCACSS